MWGDYEKRIEISPSISTKRNMHNESSKSKATHSRAASTNTKG
jgi:hypothetical protein